MYLIFLIRGLDFAPPRAAGYYQEQFSIVISPLRGEGNETHVLPRPYRLAGVKNKSPRRGHIAMECNKCQKKHPSGVQWGIKENVSNLAPTS